MKSTSSFLKGLINKISKDKATKVTFILTGILSTAWFLVRVIPKPSRAAYPCMRTAAPIMSAFVLWLLSVAGAGLALKKARINLGRSKVLAASFFLVLALVFSTIIISLPRGNSFAMRSPEWKVIPNSPVGDAKGINPGRVIWAHDRKVTSWDGKTGNWWDDNVVSQAECNKMLLGSLVALTSEKSEKRAWKALFTHFNIEKRGRKSGYTAGEKIAIKINTNNTYSHKDSEEINATPQMVYALLSSLINEGLVGQANITVFDASRHITDNIFNKCHAAFPDVKFVDNIGGDGRIKSEYIDNAIPYSVDNGKLATGLARCAVEADYLINMALLKGHVGQGVTLCAKNFYGVTSINKDWRKNFHDNFNQDRTGKATYLTFVDYMAHPDLGRKTMLYLIDGVYGSKLVNGPPGPKWNMAPFNNYWGCTLLVSQDPVAIDAVGLDFIRTEWPDAPDMAFSDMYLYEAAQAGNPPSGAKYDPARKNEKISSLGVMEHWNNPIEKKYSRNLGKKSGIELVSLVL
ncbi:MAG: DUF362 domain-containing protein [Bacteroidales bacterium]